MCREIISLCISPSLIRPEQVVSVLFRHRIPFALQAEACILPVDLRYPVYIIRLLHPAFDLKRIDACLQKFRQKIYGTKILQT